MTESKKVPLILFSGGLDSTYLLQEQLEKGDVEVLYVEGRQSPAKVKAELRARENIIRVLEDITGNKVIAQHEIKSIPEYTVQGYGRRDPNDMDWKFQQPYQWLLGALHAADGRRHSALMIAYVTGDQISPDLTKIQEAWNVMMSFTKQTPVPLEYPVVYHRKYQIVQRMYAKVYRHHWVCELPVVIYVDEEKSKSRHLRDLTQYKACGKCEACLTHLATNFIFEKMYRPVEEVMRRRLKSEVEDDFRKKKLRKRQEAREIKELSEIESGDLVDVEN